MFIESTVLHVRGGGQGKACTLIGEGRRQLMTSIMKDAEQKRAL